MQLVSVIIPTYNEQEFIDTLLTNISEQDYPSEFIELLIADGNSTDNTIAKLSAWKSKMPSLKILSNERRYVPHGLNICIKESKGEIIVRLDAHCLYPKNYISRLVDVLNELKADNTGGVWITKPGANSMEAHAIALVASHPLGIGNALYKTGGATEITEVETVAFGCFRKNIFERIGLFDEELLRNQDDEFNARIIKNGGHIFLIPDVQVDYYARPTRKKLAVVYYQYGFFKPLVNRKLRHAATLRQFAPPALVSAIIALGLLSLFSKYFAIAFLLFVFIYFLPILLVSLKLKKGRPAAILPHLILTFPVLHFSYGWGYLKGILSFLIFRKGINADDEIKHNR